MATGFVHQIVTAPPAFRVGLRVKVSGYFGTLPADDGRPDNGVVTAVRLAAEVSDDWSAEENARTVCYPKGWEYLVSRIDRPWKDWGWATEEDLIGNGYKPTKDLDPDAVFPSASGERTCDQSQTLNVRA